MKPVDDGLGLLLDDDLPQGNAQNMKLRGFVTFLILSFHLTFGGPNFVGSTQPVNLFRRL